MRTPGMQLRAGEGQKILRPVLRRRALRHVVTVAINRHVPFLEQPFRYITPVSIALAPIFQLTRRGIRFGNEAQMPHYDFKLGCSRGSWRGITAPVRISTWAAHTFKILSKAAVPSAEEGEHKKQRHPKYRANEEIVLPFSAVAQRYLPRSPLCLGIDSRNPRRIDGQFTFGR